MLERNKNKQLVVFMTKILLVKVNEERYYIKSTLDEALSGVKIQVRSVHHFRGIVQPGSGHHRPSHVSSKDHNWFKCHHKFTLTSIHDKQSKVH